MDILNKIENQNIFAVKVEFDEYVDYFIHNFGEITALEIEDIGSIECKTARFRRRKNGNIIESNIL